MLCICSTLRSLLLLTAVGLAISAHSCIAGTVPNRARVQPTIAQDGDKKPATGTGRMAHPAFANAGTAKGLQVWRIEVTQRV